MIKRWARPNNLVSCIGWIIVAAVVLFILMGLVTNGIDLGVSDAAVATSSDSDGAVIHTLKVICPFH